MKRSAFDLKEVDGSSPEKIRSMMDTMKTGEMVDMTDFITKFGNISKEEYSTIQKKAKESENAEELEEIQTEAFQYMFRFMMKLEESYKDERSQAQPFEPTQVSSTLESMSGAAVTIQKNYRSYKVRKQLELDVEKTEFQLSQLQNKQSEKMVIDQFIFALKQKQITPEAFFRIADQRFKKVLKADQFKLSI